MIHQLVETLDFLSFQIKTYSYIVLKVFHIKLSQGNRQFRQLFHRKIGKNRLSMVSMY